MTRNDKPISPDLSTVDEYMAAHPATPVEQMPGLVEYLKRLDERDERLYQAWLKARAKRARESKA